MHPQGTKKKGLRKKGSKDLDSNQSSLAGDTVGSTVPIKKRMSNKKREIKDYSKSLR